MVFSMPKQEEPGKKIESKIYDGMAVIKMSNLIEIGFAVLCIGSGLLMVALASVLFYSLYQDFVDYKKDRAIRREIKQLLS